MVRMLLALFHSADKSFYCCYIFRGFLLFVTQNDGVPALVTLKKGLVALARQWMKFIVVTQGFKAIGLMRPNQLAKPKEPQQSLGDTTMGLDNGAALQSDTSADGAEFEFDAGGKFRLSVSHNCHCIETIKFLTFVYGNMQADTC